MEIKHARCAAIDIGKTEIAVCVRTPGDAPGERVEQIRKYKTFYGVLKEMCAWLTAEGVTFVAMEATGIYTNPIFYALLDFGTVEEVIKVNPAQVKALSGRKTDAADASWQCQLAECGLLSGSWIPPEQIAQARDLTRYRSKLVQARTSEIQRGAPQVSCIRGRHEVA
jgi:transposase